MPKNKTLLFLSAIILCALAYHISGSTNENPRDKTAIPVLYEKNGKINPTLLSLLQTVSISHANTLESIVDSTQKSWLRKSGQERWDLSNTYSQALNSLIVNHCLELNMINEIIPSRNHFNYALVMGASLETIRNRFAFLLKLIDNGITFDSIVFLTGQRSLDPTLESSEKLLDLKNANLPINPNRSLKGTLPSNETEMIRMVISQTDLSTSTHSKITVVDTPCKITDSGTVMRPTTGDTFASWLKDNPKPGSALIISSQPYVGYQDMVARTYLPTTFTVDSSGCVHKEPIIDADLLDTLARWIYQTKLYLSK